jgi:hypothetical protein
VNQTLLTLGVLVTVTALASLARLRAPAPVQAKHIAGMSQQWLAENRAARPS